MDSKGQKEAQVQPYSPGSASVPRREAYWRHLENTPSAAAMRSMSNYFDHLLVFIVTRAVHRGLLES